MFIHGKNCDKRMFNDWHGCGTTLIATLFLLYLKHEYYET